MPLIWQNPSSAAEWNARILDAPGQPSMFQTYEYGQGRVLAGWTPRYADVDGTAVTVHSRTAPGLGTVWYLPKGPSVATVEQFAALLPPLVEAAHREGVFLLKVEPELLETPENLAGLKALGLIPAGRMQTNVSTVFVDVSGTPDELIARFPSKTRNTIRRGLKLGVTVEHCAPEQSSYDRMWELWTEVVEDQNITTARGHDYQTTMYRVFCESGMGRIFIGQHEGRDVAAAFVTVFGDMACYRDGASTRHRPARGASQVVQWEAMQWAQSQGARRYDMGGVPHSSNVDDPDDPYYGLGQFKRSFHKEVTDFVGAFDVAVRPRRYAAWNKLGHRVVAKVLSRGRSGATFF